jgi:hypothetical protein
MSTMERVVVVRGEMDADQRVKNVAPSRFKRFLRSAAVSPSQGENWRDILSDMLQTSNLFLRGDVGAN